MSQETRGKILTSGEPKPIDQAVQSLMDAAEVTYHLLPMRDGPKSDPPIKDPKPKKNPKNPNPRDRRRAGEERDPKTLKIDIPDGCTAKNDSNQNICFACPVRGFKCRRSIHVCWKKGCFGKHAFPDCPKEKTSEWQLRGSVMDDNDPGPSACVSTPKGSHSAELNLPDIDEINIWTFHFRWRCSLRELQPIKFNVSSNELIFLEVFAGSGNLSEAVRQKGFFVHATDLNGNQGFLSTSLILQGTVMWRWLWTWQLMPILGWRILHHHVVLRQKQENVLYQKRCNQSVQYL